MIYADLFSEMLLQRRFDLAQIGRGEKVVAEGYLRCGFIVFFQSITRVARADVLWLVLDVRGPESKFFYNMVWLVVIGG